MFRFSFLPTLQACTMRFLLPVACGAACVAPGTTDEAQVNAVGSHDDDHAPIRLQTAPPVDTDGAPHAAHDHCVAGEPPDARAARVRDVPDAWRSPRNGAVDLVLPKDVLDWMGTRTWEASHDAWHNVRRCRRGFGSASKGLCARPELVPAAQECASAEDGYQFLVMHRHMMQALRQAFPGTPDLFAGFPSFPFEAKNVPELWRERFGTGWAASMRQTATVLEDIEKQLSRFPTEGDLGRFIQCGGTGSGANSIHGALHFKWVVNDSPHSLGKQTVNIDNYMFWKLHGWIDKIWERYRVAKALTREEPKYAKMMLDQCREMDTLRSYKRGVRPPMVPARTTPQFVETGYFHEQVRPILEEHCSTCHSASSPEAALSLGGKLTSAQVYKNLVNVRSLRGGQFARVLPGVPDQSWLYLKMSGNAATTPCTGADCNVQVMPPTGEVTVPEAQLDVVYKWIADGAPAPSTRAVP